MFPASPTNFRRRLLAAWAGASAFGLVFAASWHAETALAAEDVTDSKERTTALGASEIRPFHVHVPDAVLVDLRRRLAATRWPDKESRIRAAMKRGFQTRDAEMALARLLGDLAGL